MKAQKKKFNFKYIMLAVAMLCCSLFSFISTKPTNSVKASVTNVYNNAIFITFKDGDSSWIDTTNAEYEDTYSNLYNSALNASPNSVQNYYDTMSYGSLNLETNFYTKSGKAVQVPYTLNELLPYSPNNPDGYFESEAAVYSSTGTPSMLSQGYLSSTHKYNIYSCAKYNSYHSGVPCDTDLSDGIGCTCAYLAYKERSSENVVLYKHVEQYFRLMIALNSVLEQVNTTITGDVDYNNDGYVDMLSFVFPEVASGKVTWSDLLWAHQGQLNISDYIPSSLKNSSLLLNLLQMRGLRNGTTTEIEYILNSHTINNKKPKNYICLTTEHLIGSTPLVDANGKKTLTNFVFAHELGHALGLPDFYVYNSDQNKEPVSYWDLMGYNYNGFPVYLSTYSRKLLGFTNANNIKKIESNGIYSLKPTSYDEVNNNSKNSNNVLAYYIEDENFPNQKIYFEYRYKQGKYDSGPSWKDNALIIYRVDEAISQAKEYSHLLSSGNFYGSPFNVEVLAARGSGNFGSNDTSVTTNAITFQSYDSSKNQYDLSINDVTLVNTGIVIKDISIDKSTNEISFTAQIGVTPEPVDLSSISLNGGSQVQHEVNTTYSDLGIDFGEFSQYEFDVETSNLVDATTLGRYTYTYRLTHKITKQTLTLTRTVVVVDTTKPTITLNGDTVISLDSFDDYNELGFTVTDNYDDANTIVVNTQTSYDSSTNTYTITYTATDSSGNTQIATRTIKISKIGGVQLNGSKSIKHEVKENYVDAGLIFNSCSEEDFEIATSSDLNINALGEYTYTYIIIDKTTNKQITLSRKITVADTTAPTIVILEDVEIFKDELEAYLSNNTVSYYDNFYDNSEITFTSKKDTYENKVVLTYTAKDPSGNESKKTRTFTFKYILIEEENINFVISSTSINKKYYKNSSINFSFNIKANSALDLSRMESLNLITWTIDYQVKDELKNKQNATIKFTEPGIHKIEISINGRKAYSTEIEITDPNSNSSTNASADNASLFIILGVIFVVGGSSIPVIMAVKKKQEDLDKY